MWPFSLMRAKCFQKGTKIKMYNGLAKNIEDISVGETVMGIDSKPRHVLSTTSGKSEMFNIIPNVIWWNLYS